jgi:hypothetical protein
MRLSVFRRALPAALVVAGLVLPAALAAPAGTPPETKPHADSAAERVRHALDQVAETVEIIDQPLELAIAQVHEQTKVNFVLDKLTIQQMGVDPSSAAVNLRLQNVKWKTALRTMLGQYNLNFAIVGETVIITSEDQAMVRQMRQRVSVDLDRVQMANALKQLAKDTSTNLIVDARVLKDAQTPVSLQLEDVPLETAVRLIAEMAGLKPVRVGNVLFVTTKANAAEMRADADLVPPMQPGQPQAENAIQAVIGGQAVPVVPPAAAAPPPPAPPPVAKPDEKKDTPPADKPDKDQPEKGDKPADKPPQDKPDKSDKP